MTDNHKKEISRRLFGRQAGTYALGGLAMLFGVGCGESTSHGFHNPTQDTEQSDDQQEFPEQDTETESGTDTEGNPIEITIDDRVLTSAREDGQLGFYNGNGQAYAAELPIYQGVGDTVAASVLINELPGQPAGQELGNYTGATAMATFDFAKRYNDGKSDDAAQSDINFYEGLINTVASHIEDMIGNSDSAEEHAIYLLDKLTASYNSDDDTGLTLDENETVNFANLETGLDGVYGTLPGATAALFIPVKVDGNKRMLAVYQDSRSVSAQDYEQTALFGQGLQDFVQFVIDDANTGF